MRVLAFAVAFAVAGAAALAGSDARATELPPALQKELLAIYDKHNAAAKKGDFKAALALRPAKRRAAIEKALKDPEEKEFVVAMLRFVPEQYTVEHGELGEGGNRAEIETVGTMVAPPHARGKDGVPADGRVKQEVRLSFVKEKAGWRYDVPTWGPRVDQIKACDETVAAREADFDAAKDASMGGMVRRVAFAEGYTVFVARIVDEESCFYLPDRETLRKGGFNTDILAPRAIFEAEVNPHRTDPQRVWVTDITVRK